MFDTEEVPGLEYWLEDQGYPDYECGAYEFTNLFTGEVGYQVRVYLNEVDLEREWWTKVSYLP